MGQTTDVHRVILLRFNSIAKTEIIVAVNVCYPFKPISNEWALIAWTIHTRWCWWLHVRKLHQFTPSVVLEEAGRIFLASFG